VVRWYPWGVVVLFVAGTWLSTLLLAGCSRAPMPGPSPAGQEPSSTSSEPREAVPGENTGPGDRIELPPPLKGDLPLEEAIERRRSAREYLEGAISPAEAGTLLWAAQGVTSPQGLRAAPSAGGTFPLTLYLVAGIVEGLEPGVYRYVPEGHLLEAMRRGDLRVDLAAAALGQQWVEEAPLSLVLAADYGRTTGVYGQRGVRYVHMEVGHASQNLYLEAVSLGLGTVAVGAFDDAGVNRLLELPPGEEVLYVMPVGRTAR